MNEYYVYEYWRLDNNTCFYVGKGKNNRCYQVDNRNNLFKKVMNKTECAVVIVKEGLSEEEAHNVERKLIYKYVFEECYGITINRNCISGEPYLVNATWGGEGCSGRKMTSHTKEKIRQANIGKVPSKRSKELNRLKHLGKTHTMETRKKIGQSSIGRNSGSDNWQSRNVICLNNKEMFETIIEASRKYNLFSVNIVKCCKHKIKFSGTLNGQNLVWMYYDEYLSKTSEDVNKILSEGIKKKNHESYKIICLENKKIFNSIEEAKDFYGLKSGSGIGRCLKQQRGTSGGYHWLLYDEYIKLDFLPTNTLLSGKIKSGKKIICVELSKIFDSIEEAKRFCNLKSATGIRSCLSGKRKTAGGYHWEIYKD